MLSQRNRIHNQPLVRLRRLLPQRTPLFLRAPVGYRQGTVLTPHFADFNVDGN